MHAREHIHATPASARVLDWIIEPIEALIVPDKLAPHFAIPASTARLIKNFVVRLIPNDEFEAAATRFESWSAERRSAACLGLGAYVGKALLHHLSTPAARGAMITEHGDQAVSSTRLLAQALSVRADVVRVSAKWPDALYDPDMLVDFDDEEPHPFEVRTKEILADLAPFQAVGRGAELAILMEVVPSAGRLYTLIDWFSNYRSVIDPLAQALALRALAVASKASGLDARDNPELLLAYTDDTASAIQGAQRILSMYEFPDVVTCLQKARGLVSAPVEAVIQEFVNALRGRMGEGGFRKGRSGVLGVDDPRCVEALEAASELVGFVRRAGAHANHLGFTRAYRQAVDAAKNDLALYGEQAIGMMRSGDEEATDNARAVIEHVAWLLTQLGDEDAAVSWRRRAASAAT